MGGAHDPGRSPFSPFGDVGGTRAAAAAAPACDQAKQAPDARAMLDLSRVVPGRAARAGYEHLGRADSVYHPGLRASGKQPGAGAFGEPYHQDLSSEEITALKRQLPDLMARSSTDPEARAQLLRLYKNTAMQPAYSHKNIERHQEITRKALPTTHRLQAAKKVSEDTVTRRDAQAQYPHLDLRGVFVRLMSPNKLFFKIDYYNDAPYLTTSQLYRLPAVVRTTERFFFWWEQYCLAEMIAYLRRTICRPFHFTPMYLLHTYKGVYRRILDLEADIKTQQFERGSVPADAYQQGLELCARTVPMPIMNRPVMNIVDAGVLPFELLRLFVERRVQMENVYTEFARHLHQTDPELTFYSGPTQDADRIERDMATMYTRYTQHSMARQDNAMRVARDQQSGQQTYARLHGDDNELTWNQRLPRSGMSAKRRGYPTEFAAHQFAGSGTTQNQDLNEIYSFMEQAA